MKALYRKFCLLLRRISVLHISVYAGNAAFFLLLSVFPATLLLLSAVQYTPVSVEDVAKLASAIMPKPVNDLFRTVLYNLEPRKALAVLSASTIGTFWTFMRSMNTLRMGLEAVQNISASRKLVLNWMICLLCAVLFFLCIFAMLIFQIFGEVIYDFALMHQWRFANFIAGILRIRSVFSTCFLILVFCLFYTILPAGCHKFILHLPGALFSAVGWLLFSSLFGIYVEFFSRYSILYGGLTVVVVTMLWLYFCLNLLFYGELFNRFLQEHPHPFRTLWAFFKD